jgi:diacylglycerol kinase family enzyme
MTKFLLVGNPTAQSGKNAERIEKARELFGENNLEHDFLATAPAGGTVEVVRRALAGGAYHTAVYMGGDGTFAEVAKGILAAKAGETVRLGMLPTGTANDQGKSFGLSSEEEELPRNVSVLAAGHETRLDAGRLTALDDDGNQLRQDWFFDSAGWGISPRVLKVRNDDRKAVEKIPFLRDLWRDQLVYAGALFRTFLASYVDDDKFDATVECDGATRLYAGLTDLVVKGTRIYGGAWVFVPEAQHDDGKFEVVPFTGKRDWISKAIVHLDDSGSTAEALETLGVSHSEGMAGARIDIEMRPHSGGLPLCAQIDGEELECTRHVRIEVVPRVLRVIIPA